ncbi:MAG: prepilin-type N-terminal cleavage/methylation domain-containing protein [Planctomycetes bacterium]|nr:prepilin-type N-terminal cleavage/methylation domain-containing protein [Planctomycetota bacterium]
MRRRNERGFTLIEMLVVVAIIILVVTMSLAMLNTRNTAPRQAGTLVQAAFTYARQVASSERVIVWLVFMPRVEDGVNVYDRIALCRDTGTNPGVWDPGDANDMIDAPIALPKAAQFDVASSPLLAGAGGAAARISVRPDGSVLFPTGTPDLTWTAGATQADLVIALKQAPVGARKLFMDISSITGMFRRIEYQ